MIEKTVRAETFCGEFTLFYKRASVFYFPRPFSECTETIFPDRENSSHFGKLSIFMLRNTCHFHNSGPDCKLGSYFVAFRLSFVAFTGL